MQAIVLDEVDKNYRSDWGKKTVALKNLSLVIEVGEAFGYVGQNGAGKSTTIKILTGALEPSAGMAFLFGCPATDYKSRLGLAYVPESPYLYDYLTPLELVRMGASLHKVKVDDLNAHCMYWLERFGIAHVAGKRIRNLSKGMTQRTALAHALALKPRLLILDEPLSGLDPIGRKDVVDILMEYKREGGTLFFSSHVLHDVERLADRFGLIHKGELRAVRTPAEILGSDGGKMLVRYRAEQCLENALAESPGVWRTEVDRSRLNELLSKIEAAGGLLAEVKSTATLETAFMEFILSSAGQEPRAQ